jgi:uncharacterized protein
MPAFIEQYSILFKSLRTGIHSFKFVMDSRFFEHFDNPECPGGAFSVDLEMDKKSHLLSMFFTFSGEATVTCDRCLDEFSLPLEFNTRLFVRFGEEVMETDADVIYLDPNEHKLNLAEYLLESICLNLPVKRVHENIDDCNRDMIRKLNKHVIKPDEKGTDPRWDSLRDINKNKN